VTTASPPADLSSPATIGDDFPAVLRAARAGEPWAFARVHSWLARTVAGYLRSQGAEDPDGLANDVFLRAFTNLHRFEGSERNFRSWVLTIAHHRLVDQRRRAARRPVSESLDSFLETRATGDVEHEALTRVGTDRVHRLLGRLAPDQRDVILLRIVADLTVEQVAEALGKTPGAVKQLQRRGLAALQRILADGDA